MLTAIERPKEAAARRPWTHLDALEAEAIFILREVAAECRNVALLFSGGKDSAVVLRLAERAFFHLDAPVQRLAMPDVPSPHSPRLLEAVVPSVGDIVAAMRRIASY